MSARCIFCNVSQLKTERLAVSLQVATADIYFRRSLASGESIVTLGVRLCVCPPSRDCTPHAALVSAAKVTRCIHVSSLYVLLASDFLLHTAAD